MNRGISCATSTAWTSWYFTISSSRIDTKSDYKTTKFNPFIFLKLSSADRRKALYENKFLFHYLQHYWQQQQFPGMPVSHQLWSIHENKLAATHPIPLPPAGKARLASKNHITSSSPPPHTPCSCPPFATSLLSSVRARITAGTGRAKDLLLTEKGKQGTD